MPRDISHLWIIVILCLFPAVIAILKRSRFHLPAAVNGILLVPVMIWLHYSERDPTALISTVIYFAGIICPLMLQKRISDSILERNLPKARKLLFILKFISPAFPFSECKTNIKILEKAAEEHVPIQLLRDLKCSSFASVTAAVQVHFSCSDWESSDYWLKSFKKDTVRTMPWLSLLKIRVECEKGNLTQAAEIINEILTRQNQLSYFIFHLIYLCAYSGNKEKLETLFKIETQIQEESKELWLATADFHNLHNSEEGRLALQELCSSSDKRISRAAALMLKSECKNELDESELDLLFKKYFENYEDFSAPERKKTYWTWILMGTNIIVFLLSMKENGRFADKIIDDFAMLMPEMTETGEYWRMLTTTFIHGSPLHLISNMAMLFIFGILIEPLFNTFKFLFIYLGAAVAGMIIVALLTKEGEYTITIGASGSTMALLGAYIAVLLKKNRRAPVKIRRQQLILLFCFIVIQSRIDLLSEEISFTAHISGLVFGLITAYFLYKEVKPQTGTAIEPIEQKPQ